MREQSASRDEKKKKTYAAVAGALSAAARVARARFRSTARKWLLGGFVCFVVSSCSLLAAPQISPRGRPPFMPPTPCPLPHGKHDSPL
ncbi:hypothetical protein EJ06DRAFT_110053 [Trichodelitschia bisporula]|uniref:Uncharacterized protein n=1 Tax=Trichodelitschia bisporula TaxID=703511 RepID=A0A6G1HR50_9PEZI|nr:hypothetical protein EJ06DRAFT_110053 [Trichodelitschia bisporula]